MIFFYLSNEGISIPENAARIGLPVQEKLKGGLPQLREEKAGLREPGRGGIGRLSGFGSICIWMGMISG